jgi:hypothetical protein
MVIRMPLGMKLRFRSVTSIEHLTDCCANGLTLWLRHLQRPTMFREETSTPASAHITPEDGAPARCVSPARHITGLSPSDSSTV